MEELKGFIEVNYIDCDYSLVKTKIHYSQLRFKKDGSVKLYTRPLKESYEEIKQLIKNAQ